MSAGLSEQQHLTAADTPAAGTPAAETAVAPAAPPPPRHGLHWTGRASLVSAPLAFLALAWGGGAYLHSHLAPAPQPRPVPPIAAVVSQPDGAALYSFHCARCHGENGDGKGVVQVDPPARYFGFEKFKFARTVNGVPTDDDLLGILRRGIPGTSMPAFDAVPEADLRAIIDHVRRLTRAGLYARMHKEGMKKYDDGDDDLPNPAALFQKAHGQALPGQLLSPPGDLGPTTPEAVARGRAAYEKACMSCHGPQGAGDGPQVKDMKDELGRPTRPRNLTAGVYKGGGDAEHLHARIVLGIPGTPMPASATLPPAEVRDLVHYIRSLAQPTAAAPAAVMQAGK